MFTKVKAPESLISRNLSNHLLEMLQQLIRQVDTLNSVVKDCHSHYYSFSKELLKNCTLFETNIQRTTSPLSVSGMELSKTMQQLGHSLEKQTNKNLVGLKSLGSERDENIHAVVADKFSKVDARIRHYEQLTRQLQEVQTKYNCKSQRFADMEIDTVKYYSTSFLRHKYDKLTIMQMQMQKLLEKLKQERLEIQFGCRELKKLISELVGGLYRKVREITRAVKLIIGRLVNFEQLIFEEGSRDDLTIASQGFQMPDERVMLDYSEQYLQRLINTLAIGQAVRESIAIFLSNIVGLMGQHCQALLNIQRGTAFLSFHKGKFAAENNFGPKLYEEFCEAQRQICAYSSLIQKFASKLDRSKYLNELSMVQKVHTQQFVKSYQQALAGYRSVNERKTYASGHQLILESQAMRSLTERTFAQLKLLLTKFSLKDESLNSKFRLECQNILHNARELMREYEQHYSAHALNRPITVTEQELAKIYERRYFEVFISHFVLQDGDYTFEPNKHVEVYLRLRRQSEAEAEELQQSQFVPERSSFFGRCCGMVTVNRKAPTNDEVIDQFNCALSYGILLQGKMYAHRRLLRFVSIFNRKTFFGKTELEIPKRDILKIEGLINHYIIITTKHGQLKFTSFITNPVGLLRDLYVEGKQMKQLAKKVWSEPINDGQLKEVQDRWVQALQVERFTNTGVDTYAKEISNFACYSTIERTPTMLFITFDYRPIQKSSIQPERYLMRVVQQTNSLRCEIEDISRSSGVRTMKDHFMDLIKSVLQPFDNNSRLAEQQLSKNKSLILELDALDTVKLERNKKSFEPVGETSPFLLVTESSTLLPTPKNTAPEQRPNLLKVPSSPTDSRYTFNNVQRQPELPVAVNNLILVSDRAMERTASEPVQPIFSTPRTKLDNLRKLSQSQIPSVKMLPLLSAKKPSHNHVAQPSSNNFALYVSTIAVLILLILILR